MTSREAILSKLQDTQRPYLQVEVPTPHLPVTPLAETSPAALMERFIVEAEAISTVIHQPASEEAAIRTVLDLLGDDEKVLAWSWEDIPLSGLERALEERGISVAAPADPLVRAGISGVDALLAATGSFVVRSDEGRSRTTSLLPPIHIALVTEAQLLPDLEGWVARERERGLANFRRASNIVVISGPSRTADIAMELILGMHGPREVHVIFCPSA